MPALANGFPWLEFDALLKFGPSLRYCSEYLGITSDGILEHIRRKWNMDFSEYRDWKMDDTRLKLQQVMITKALEGDNTALIFCLKNLCKWSDNNPIQRVDNTQPIVLNYQLNESKHPEP